MANQSVNDVFDLGLKPLELLLYAHLKRAAGGNLDGKCTKSTGTLVRETGMGAGTISRMKAEVAKCLPDLKNKPLMTIPEIPNPKDGKALAHHDHQHPWRKSEHRCISCGTADLTEDSTADRGVMVCALCLQTRLSDVNTLAVEFWRLRGYAERELEP